jgi:[glutamine synthetase] adenylyltransferase / [glutamine synthetase]-adenylyl-L-tyrosine phosphorylase
MNRTMRPRSQRASPARLTALLSPRAPRAATADALLRDHGFREPANVRIAIGRLFTDDLQRRALSKIFPHLIHACAESADPDRALLGFERLAAALPNPGMFYHYLKAAPDRLDMLVTVFAHSQALADTLVRNAEHFHFLIAPETLAKPRAKPWLDAELRRLLLVVRVPEQRYDVIRRFRRRETLRIGTRDLLGLATVEETTLELSNLADVCLQAVFETALAGLQARFKLSASAAAESGQFAIIGMGKLGGQELNYSSDVDVMFVYEHDGDLTPTISRHEFFTKLAEEFIRVVGGTGAEGTIFRIDLRLRPEGRNGPLARSLESYEDYYAQWGETWERMALVKARPVAGDAALGDRFIRMVQPFVYARYASENVVQQMAALKQRIENEIVGDNQLTRHVKLGIGGIREIEFIVQSFQVLRGARLMALRERSTLRALTLLARHRLLTEPEAAALADAYRFLRNVEHRLQMEMELQTHTIPDEERALVRLSRSLGFASVEKFFAAREAKTSAVRRIYEGVLAAAGAENPAADNLLAPEKLPALLTASGFASVPAAVKSIEGLLHGPGFGHVSERTKDLFGGLFPKLLATAATVADPDGALLRFTRFVNAYGTRGLLYENLVNHPKLVEMLVRLGDASPFLSDVMVNQPELFDEISEGGLLMEPKSFERMWSELTAARGHVSSVSPSEIRSNVALHGGDMAEHARVWKRAELLRIGIEDVMGFSDLEQFQQEMTALAEACLRLAVEEARHELKLEDFPFTVIGTGKLGGLELGYGADLDVLFVGGMEDAGYARANKLAAKVVEFMALPTGAGTLFAVDARLRPDGEKGPLASPLAAHREYYRTRAQLWERQALIKARWVAGDAALGKQFIQTTQEIVYEHALTPAELQEIRQMRRRVETERGDQKYIELELKTGPGGLIDVEFVVQALQLRHGHAQPQLRTAHTLAALNRLAAIGAVDEEASYQLRHGYQFLRRIELVLRRVDNTSVSRIPVDEREQSFLAKRLGFASTDEFFGNYRLLTQRIRALYDRLLAPAA